MQVGGLVLGALLLVGMAACRGGDDSQAEGGAGGQVHSVGDARLAADAVAAVRSHELPTLGIARLSTAGGVASAVAGTLAHDDATPTPLDAPFHLGSNTKAMTAMLLATLVEEGRLGFEDRIVDLLPDASVDPSLAPVTIRDVLGHRTGLEPILDLPGLHAAADPVAARRQAVVDALAYPEHAPGTFVYANVNYMLAGVVAEEIAGGTWEELIDERIFQPLGMRCGFGAPRGALAPVGHEEDGTPIARDAAITDNPPALGPAGTVHCSLQSWAEFAGAVLEVLAGRDSTILRASTASDLFSGDREYVAGWTRLDHDGQPLYVHDGSNTLWYARVVLAPHREEGLLLASNTGESGAVDAIEELTRAFLDD